MFTLNPDSPNPNLLNLLLNGAFVTFDGGCYIRRVEMSDGFYVEVGIGLTRHRARFDLAEGELCLRKVAEWFAAKRGELLKNISVVEELDRGIELPDEVKDRLLMIGRQGLITPLDAEMLRHIESGRVKYKDELPPGPVYHGQVAPGYEETKKE